MDGFLTHNESYSLGQQCLCPVHNGQISMSTSRLLLIQGNCNISRPHLCAVTLKDDILIYGPNDLRKRQIIALPVIALMTGLSEDSEMFLLESARQSKCFTYKMLNHVAHNGCMNVHTSYCRYFLVGSRLIYFTAIAHSSIHSLGSICCRWVIFKQENQVPRD